MEKVFIFHIIFFYSLIYLINFYNHSSLWKVSDEIRDSDSEQGEDEQEAHFEVVVSDMVTSGYADGHPTDSIALEIKSYKFAQNKVNYFLLFLLIIIIYYF